MKKESIHDDLTLSLDKHKGKPELMVVVASQNMFEAMRICNALGAKVVTDYSREVGDWSLFSGTNYQDSASQYEVPA